MTRADKIADTMPTRNPDIDPVQPLCVIIPASNEEGYIGRCLAALLAQDAAAGAVQVVVAANGCRDRTAQSARQHADAFTARGWVLEVLDIPEGGKTNALNRAEAVAQAGARVFLDADVICDPALLGQLRQALVTDAPRYATGTLQVTRAKTAVTRAYARLWTRLPFVQGGAVGAGLFAVNPAGRARWGAFPAIISDDTFVRLNFAPDERIEVPARYHWPMIEGFSGLVRVRRRQDAGVAEVRRLYPDLGAHEDTARLTPGRIARLFLTAPVGFITYALVHVAVRLGRQDETWTRGR